MPLPLPLAWAVPAPAIRISPNTARVTAVALHKEAYSVRGSFIYFVLSPSLCLGPVSVFW